MPKFIMLKYVGHTPEKPQWLVLNVKCISNISAWLDDTDERHTYVYLMNGGSHKVQNPVNEIFEMINANEG